MLFNSIILKQLLNPTKVYNLESFKPAKGFCYDSRKIKKGQAFIAVKGKYQDGHDFIAQAVKRGARVVIAEKLPRIKTKACFFKVKDTYSSLKAIAHYIRMKKKPFVFAITGSVGKTTTKEMLDFLLKKRLTVAKNEKTENNILGLAKTLFNLKNQKVLVVELGTNHPGEIKDLAAIVHPDVGIITFVKPVHLEGLGTLAGIFKEKTSLLKANPEIKPVLNRDDEHLVNVKSTKKIYWFGKEKGNYVQAELLKEKMGEATFLINGAFKLVMPPGKSVFIANALAAIAAARLLGLNLPYLVKRLNSFKAYPFGRMQILKKRGMLFVNDAYNANPFSVEQAINTASKFPQKVKIIVIGDMLELGKQSSRYHKYLAKNIISAGFNYCLTYGKLAKFLGTELKILGYNKVLHCLSQNEAALSIMKIARKAKKNVLVLIKGSRAMALDKIIELCK